MIDANFSISTHGGIIYPKGGKKMNRLDEKETRFPGSWQTSDVSRSIEVDREDHIYFDNPTMLIYGTKKYLVNAARREPRQSSAH